MTFHVTCIEIMEHLNKWLKMMMHNLRSNVTPGPAAVKRCAKAPGTVNHICSNSRFEQERNLFTNKNHHTMPSFSTDSKIQNQLERDKAFVVTTN